MIIAAKQDIKSNDGKSFIRQGDQAFISQSGCVYFTFFDSQTKKKVGPAAIGVVENFIEHRETLLKNFDIYDTDNHDYRN